MTEGQGVMRAAVHDRYGPPAEVLYVKEVARPEPGTGQVRVRIAAAGANAGDWHVIRADPFLMRLIYGMLRPKHRIPGSDFAGHVDAVGSGATRFRPGDAVVGSVAEHGFGAFAEYVCAPESALVPMPADTTFEEAAATPTSAIAALQGLRDKGGLRAGQRVLVNGASGGLGSFAVQIAKAHDARVTGVCSTRHIELVASIGADHVIDYKRTDPTRTGESYDLILDTAAFRSPADYLPILTEGGTYVFVGGATSRMFQTMLTAPRVNRKGRHRIASLLSEPNAEDLATVRDLLDSGRVRAVIDRVFPLEDVREAMQHLETGHPGGKIVLTA